MTAVRNPEDDRWMIRAAMAACALAELERELSAVPTPHNLRLLEIVRRGLKDVVSGCA